MNYKRKLIASHIYITEYTSPTLDPFFLKKILQHQDDASLALHSSLGPMPWQRNPRTYSNPFSTTSRSSLVNNISSYYSM